MNTKDQSKTKNKLKKSPFLLQNIPRDILCYDSTNFLRDQTSNEASVASVGSYRIEGVYQQVFSTECEPKIDRAETGVKLLLRILMQMGHEFIADTKEQCIYMKDVNMGR